MDKVAHQLAVVFGISGDHGESGFSFICVFYLTFVYARAPKESLPSNRGSVGCPGDTNASSLERQCSKKRWQ